MATTGTHRRTQREEGRERGRISELTGAFSEERVESGLIMYVLIIFGLQVLTVDESRVLNGTAAPELTNFRD